MSKARRDRMASGTYVRVRTPGWLHRALVMETLRINAAEGLVIEKEKGWWQPATEAYLATYLMARLLKRATPEDLSAWAVEGKAIYEAAAAEAGGPAASPSRSAGTDPAVVEPRGGGATSVVKRGEDRPGKRKTVREDVRRRPKDGPA